MIKKPTARFYDFNDRHIHKTVTPYSYDTHSSAIAVYTPEGTRHLEQYNHKVILMFQFNTKQAMQKFEGSLPDLFMFRGIEFWVQKRIECYPNRRYWTLFIHGLGEGKRLL